ncbi:MAG: 2,3-bisphosphoglycerate-independent phosphoglycerate mutase, partial [Salibacteraceae bacterium]
KDKAEGTIAQNPVLQQDFEAARKSGKAVHFMGLESDGGVHSKQSHLHHLVHMTTQAGLEKVYIHAFTDGRDTSPNGGEHYLSELEAHLKGHSAELVSVVGRYYAMDRDLRWERIKKAYDLLLEGEGAATRDFVASVKASYEQSVTDEFLLPMVKVDEVGQAIGRIQENDIVICFNYRTDRCREITQALTQQDLTDHGMHTLPLHYITMTRYDERFKNVEVVFEKQNLKDTLGEIVSKAGRQQIRIAETEKYPHVTFFFSGGQEAEFEGESRKVIASPKVATYDLQPEMSAPEVADTISAALQAGSVDFVCLNFANPDMVGHTGVFEAVVKAVETVDRCAKQVVEAGLENDYSFIIIADHGNADFMVNADGSPHTAHTTNLVPCILVDQKFEGHLREGILADVAPTLLDLMGIEQPAAMTGRSLLVPAAVNE